MNVRIHFDLITEPWIPVVNGDESISYLGIWDTLQTASKSKGISDASPLVEFGLYRLLSVFLMDALRPEDQFELEDLEKAGQFDMAKIQDYIEQCQAEGASFDLFDPVRPFLQAPYDPNWSVDKAKPVTYLDCRIPAGNNHVHFQHLQGISVFSYAEAARKLPARLIFASIEGRGYSASVNGVPPYYAMVSGENLFQTLINLMIPLDEIDDFDESQQVLWRSNFQLFSQQRFTRISWLFGMMFPSRAIHLLPEPDGIRKMYYFPGSKLEIPENWTDPNVTYIRPKKGLSKRTPWKPSGRRSVWQNLSKLLLSETAPFYIKRYSEKHNSNMSLFLYGVECNDKLSGKYENIHFYNLLIPTKWCDKATASLIEICIQLADKIASVIERTEQAPSKKIVQETVNRFYQKSEIALWDFCRAELSSDFTSEKNIYSKWANVICSIGLDAVKQTINQWGISINQWKKVYQWQSKVSRVIIRIENGAGSKNE